MCPCLGGDVQAAEHAGDFLHARWRIEFLYRSTGLPSRNVLAHREVLTGLCRDLWQVRDAQYLALAPDFSQPAADDFCNGSTPTGIDRAKN